MYLPAISIAESIYTAALASFFGAIGGGVTVLAVEQLRTRKRQVDSGNQALFGLTQIWNMLEQHRKEIVEPAKKTAVPWFQMKPVPLLSPREAQLKPENLDFLLHSYDTNVLAELALEETRFVDMLQKINERNEILRKEIYPRLFADGVRHGDAITVERLKSAVPEPMVEDFRALSEYILEYVQPNLHSLEKRFRKLRAILQLEFPLLGHFINFTFGRPHRRSLRSRYRRWRLRRQLNRQRKRMIRERLRK